MPLQFGPGEEVLVDWGEAWFIHNGCMRKVHMFCMRLCHSRASFVHAYRRENMESFLDGHVRAFLYFGGVPRQCAYDNLRCAVISVGRGRERILNRRFIELRSHYLFESRFCNVRSGHEKGHVENLVKHAQRSFMTPLPECSSLDELNACLEEQCRADLERLAPRSDKTRGELLGEERVCFLPLPAREFEACQRASTFASKQALVRFDTNDYSVPVRWAHHPVQVKGFVDRVELWAENGLVARHARSHDREQYILSPYHYIPLLERKPGGLLHGRPFKGEPWGEDFQRMRRELEYRYEGEGTKKFIRILLLFAKYPAEEVRRAVRVCAKRRAFSDEAVLSVLRFSPPSR
ncbi:MAG: IS21 family transposase, partial [Proteobacteria bacterium]|nr:IS21 family transposase [Pseudomonadota bacterium]